MDIPVDLHNFKKFPVVDPPGMHKPIGPDTRAEIRVDSSAELPDYSGPFKADLRFSDFSNQALVNMIAMSDEYYRVCVEAWACEVAKRYGHELMAEIQAEAWQTIVLPQLHQMIEEWMEISADGADALVGGGSRRGHGPEGGGRGRDDQSIPGRVNRRRLPKGEARQLGVGQPRISCSPRSRGGPGTS